WEGINDDWESWLRIRFKSTLGTALIEAAHGLCPRMGEDALILDLQPRTEQNRDDAPPTTDRSDELWLTESAIGGGGFVEEFLSRYVQDPRRFFRLLDAALAASDLELVSEELGRVLQFVTSDLDQSQPLRAGFRGVREAQNHADSVQAL